MLLFFNLELHYDVIEKTIDNLDCKKNLKRKLKDDIVAQRILINLKRNDINKKERREEIVLHSVAVVT